MSYFPVPINMEPPGSCSNVPSHSLSRTFNVSTTRCYKYTQNTSNQKQSISSLISQKYKLTNNILQTRKRRGRSITMDFRMMGLDSPLFSTLRHMIDTSEDIDKSYNAPTQTFVRDAKAMAATPVDVKEYPNSYAFIIDMPGLKSEDIKVQVEDDNVLTINGERKKEEDKEGAKYVRMERRVGKFMRKFALPENANTDAISAICQDGVLTVTVEKLPPPKHKKPKTIEVKIA